MKLLAKGAPLHNKIYKKVHAQIFWVYKLQVVFKLRPFHLAVCSNQVCVLFSSYPLLFWLTKKCGKFEMIAFWDVT